MRWMVSFTPWSLQPCGKCPGIRCVGGWLGLKWYGPFEDEEGEILWMLVLLGIEPRHLGRSASSIVSLFNHELSGGIGSGTLQGLVNCSCIPFSAVVRSYFERGGGGNRRTVRKPCPNSTFSTTNLTRVLRDDVSRCWLHVISKRRAKLTTWQCHIPGHLHS